MDSLQSVYLTPTPIIDSDHETIMGYAGDAVKDAGPDLRIILRLETCQILAVVPA